MKQVPEIIFAQKLLYRDFSLSLRLRFRNILFFVQNFRIITKFAIFWIEKSCFHLYTVFLHVFLEFTQFCLQNSFFRQEPAPPDSSIFLNGFHTWQSYKKNIFLLLKTQFPIKVPFAPAQTKNISLALTEGRIQKTTDDCKLELTRNLYFHILSPFFKENMTKSAITIYFEQFF